VILIALAAFLAVPLYYLSADWAGWLTLYASFALIPLLLPLKRRFNQVLAVWGVLVFHHLIAVCNAYVSVVPGAETDAANFHRDASAIASIGGWDFGLGSRFYSTMLALAYSLGGPSLFFGEQLSVLAFALSCVVLTRMLDLLKIERHHTACVLVFGLHPALAIFTSVTLRESWQILFFMQSAYCLLRYRVSAGPGSLLWGLLGAGLMGCLHNGLIVYALFMVPLALFSRLGIRAAVSLPRTIGLALTGTVAVGLAAAFLTGSLPYTPSLAKLSEGEALEYASTYRQRGEKGARAEYGVKLDAGSPAAFALSLPPVYASYMLAPFPWQVRTGSDLFAALDGWLRMALLFFALTALRSPPPGTPAGIPAFLLVLYGSMSVLWSMGTINYGTAIRHHIVPFWILIVLGLPPLLDRASVIFRVKLR
jgi:hypothetical protein